ncbi:hemolysin III family protein [Aeoliella sp. ICT_H6.2]|uniref:Hemolysin III family protein n=1 Tax=Aeoliella straminimaris TaxID=2954799 RepID=A0A9X2FBL2_9BACT|nr:hemolysin III family protein [Aeoliella straminimaris]MCO6045173.1 hemolysin III family protein [Aeoliella straminimaris]
MTFLLKQTRHRDYTGFEELANTITHGLAALFAAVGMILLGMWAWQSGNIWHLVGTCVFGLTMVVLYAASTIYHAVPEAMQSAKCRWQRYDQSAIFLLIAGSYTPFILSNMRTPIGWTLLAFVWIVALVGIVGELTERTNSTKIRVGIYLLMGWSCLMAIGPILEVIPAAGMGLIALGGAAYSLGVVFFLWRQLRYHHAVWHLFVIAGTAFHYMAVVYYVLPAAVA